MEIIQIFVVNSPTKPPRSTYLAVRRSGDGVNITVGHNGLHGCIAAAAEAVLLEVGVAEFGDRQSKGVRAGALEELLHLLVEELRAVLQLLPDLERVAS